MTGRRALTVGRSFSISPHRVLPIGSLVCLTDDQGVIRLGQVETHQLLPDDQMQAAGRVLGALDGKGLGNADVPLFGSVAVAEADPAMITRLNEDAEATLDIGVMSSGSDLPARLMPRRLNRHTFWCDKADPARPTRSASSSRRCCVAPGYP